MYVFVFDGCADWEPASALAELRRTFGFAIRVVGLATDAVTSMGGLKVLPDLSIFAAHADHAGILILPGGDMWMRGEVPEVTRLVNAFVASGKPVAAICAATLALAHAGLLDDRRHTSNGQGFIAKFVSKYRGKKLYQKVPAITDRGIITANGLAPFAFAAEIFRRLAPRRKNDIAMYERLYSRVLLDE